MAVGDAVAGGGAFPEYPIECLQDRPCFSKTLYKERDRVERFFNRIKQFRWVATRFEKLASNCLAMIRWR